MPSPEDTAPERPPVPYLRAWAIYIVAFAAVAIPVRLAVVWAMARWAADAAHPARAGAGAQMVTGLLLLPVSFHLFRWVVRGLVLDAARGGAAR